MKGFSVYSSCWHLDSKWGALNRCPASCWLCFQPGAQVLQLLLSEHPGHFKGCSGQSQAACQPCQAVQCLAHLCCWDARPGLSPAISPTAPNVVGVCSTHLSDRAASLPAAGSEVQLFTWNSVMLLSPLSVTSRIPPCGLMS